MKRIVKLKSLAVLYILKLAGLPVSKCNEFKFQKFNFAFCTCIHRKDYLNDTVQTFKKRSYTCCWLDCLNSELPIFLRSLWYIAVSSIHLFTISTWFCIAFSISQCHLLYINYIKLLCKFWAIDLYIFHFSAQSPLQFRHLFHRSARSFLEDVKYCTTVFTVVFWSSNHFSDEKFLNDAEGYKSDDT